ncbi:hypothetical protein ABBQ32_010167 [Trebouxia sp. C0010 RCD-2024]
MPLFGSFLDVEAGQAAAETGNMRVLRAPVVAPIIDPARLRHRAQNSQRFVCGTRLKLTCRAGSPLALWNPTRACPPSSRNRVPIIVCNVAGIVILLFLAGLVPFPSIFFLLLAMCAISSYIQYNTVIRQELERQSATTGTPGFQAQPFTHPEQAHHAAVFSMMGTLGLNEWRLGMMNRDFDESDYEMLLQLDQPRQGEASQQPAATEAQLASIPSFTVQKTKDASNDIGEKSQNVCSVCLDPFAERDQLSLLPCTHQFHTRCIRPWLQQSGIRSQCPLCKTPVFDNRISQISSSPHTPMLHEQPALPEVVPTALVSMPLQSTVLLQDGMWACGLDWLCRALCVPTMAWIGNLTTMQCLESAASPQPN